MQGALRGAGVGEWAPTVETGSCWHTGQGHPSGTQASTQGRDTPVARRQGRPRGAQQLRRVGGGVSGVAGVVSTAK